MRKSLNKYIAQKKHRNRLTVLLEGEHETGEHEDGDADDDQDQAEVFVSLVEGVHQALQTNKVTDHLENTENSHDPVKIF